MPVPKVSLIIPNYNYAHTLRLCLESVFAQTHPLHEVIVADDNSTDSSREIAGEFPCKVVRLRPNGGVSAARNAGVAASTGDILFFLDSDEALAPEAVANAVRLLEEDPRRGCVHGIFAPQPLIDDGPIEWYRTLHAYRWRMKALGPTPTAFFVATAMPRHVFEEVGPFDTRLRDSEDVEYSERLSALYDILLTDEIVAWHDEEYRLLPLLREQFRRAQLLIPFAAAHRRRPGALRANSMGGVASALLTIGTLPLTLLGWSGALVPVASAFLFAFCDPGLLRVVVRHRSAAFLPQFVACHLAVNASIGLGAATGFVRKLFDRDFGSPGARLQRDAG